MDLFKQLCPHPLQKAFCDVDLRLVGGCVRDFFLGKKICDVDLVVDIPPQEIVRRLTQNKIHYFLTGVEFGTVTAHLQGENFEMTSLRQDVSYQGRHPEVAYTKDFGQDAARRDFTFNALYVDKCEVLFDPFGGRGDLDAGIVRFIGNPGARILEDPLRILRFYRFFGKLGKSMDDASRGAARDHMNLVWGLSKERIWDELKKIFALERVFEVLRLLGEDGFYKGMKVPALNTYLPLLSPLTLFLTLDISVSMNWTKEEAKFLKTLKNLRHSHENPLSLSLHHPKNVIEQLIYLRFLDHTYTTSQMEQWTRDLSNYTVPQFPLNGDDLLSLGIEQGVDIGKILKNIRKIWEKSPQMSKEACLELIKR